MPFLPIAKEEALKRGWDELDVIFVTGDAYIDHPAFGVPLLARWLEARGFRTGIIPQPDWRTKEAFVALGRPRLFFAVSAGAMDSMVAHYTPARKLRHDDAYTPGNRHGARPNRATIVYTSRLKEAYRDVPVVIGGIEASLRRFAHYDFWEDSVRRSILFDAKADLLIYGMGENPLLELARRLRKGEPFGEITDIRGTALISRGGFETCPYVELPSFEEVSAEKKKYAEAFRKISNEQNPFCAKPLAQRHGDRLLFCNPPALPLSEQEIDSVYLLPFVKAPHPSYREPIPAYEQIRTSITTHRGCFGGCAFCAIAHHQGKIIQSRSAGSIIREIERLTEQSWFRGSISDVGGPTANMYGLGCSAPALQAGCRKGSCLYPKPCPHLVTDDLRAVELLEKARRLPRVKHVAVSSGVRFDLLERQPAYFSALLSHHVGGLLKVAPEHTVDRVLDCMRKPGKKTFEDFLGCFRKESRSLGKRHSIVPYLISGHPGCNLADMVDLALFLKRLKLRVEQVQDFTPTPGTLSTCMYHTGIDPFTGKEVYVSRSDREKRLQKAILLCHIAGERKHVMEGLRACGREA
ncbi:MAG TPA: YgiQ family radical SAM protein, partial [Geobacteraceae bacterium]|nr:YgiQ family radical SAM protein [Geobacteraceae bacterium]